MADVTRDRAQLIIVSGLALAVTLVALAVILNSAIYTGNLSTREESHDTRAAIEHQATVDESIGRAIRYVNTRNPSEPNANLSEETAVINDRLRRDTRNGVVASVSTTVTGEGTRIAQLNASRDFTNSTDRADWTVIENTKSTRTYRMRLNKSMLYDADSLMDTITMITDNALHVQITDDAGSGDTWDVYIYQSSVTGNAYLITEEPTDSFSFTGLLDIIDESCAAAGPEVVVDFKAGTFGPAPDIRSPWGVLPPLASSTSSSCSELSWYDPSEEYEIEYQNADSVAGTYELVVDRSYSSLATDSNYYDATDGDDPFAHGAITDVQVEMSYRTTEVSYSTQWTTESNQQRIFSGVAPSIDSFTVSRSDDEFTVDWDVSDVDGDLRRVNVTLYDVDDDALDERVTYTTGDPELSGDSGSDTVTLTGTEDDHSYEVWIQVRDSQGHVTYRKEESP